MSYDDWWNEPSKGFFKQIIASNRKLLKRKKNDNHTLDEMKSKRKNYLSLLKEFNEVEFIASSTNINQKILKIKNYIFKLYLKKKKIVKKNKKNIRMKWKKNYNRKLAGKNLDRSQKESFF